MLRKTYVILAILLLLCLAPMPYGYFSFIRIIAVIMFCATAYNYYQEQKHELCFIFSILAVFFQPFVKFRLSRTGWNIADVIVATFLFILYYIETHRSDSQSEQSKNDAKNFRNSSASTTVLQETLEKNSLKIKSPPPVKELSDSTLIIAVVLIFTGAIGVSVISGFIFDETRSNFIKSYSTSKNNDVIKNQTKKKGYAVRKHFKTMLVFIDRIEEPYAVLILNDGQVVDAPLNALPADITEGSWIYIDQDIPLLPIK